LTGGDDCLLNIWNWKQNKKVKSVIAHMNSTNFIAVKDEYVATGGGDGTIKLWSIDNLRKHEEIIIVIK
jgi:WD40 repeat protein